ncbi:hypothetical protein CR157_13265 [Halomonas sp. LBP4]|nr:hypothetical protein CR157_13265 [Halomonas sp. LBP4]
MSDWGIFSPIIPKLLRMEGTIIAYPLTGTERLFAPCERHSEQMYPPLFIPMVTTMNSLLFWPCRMCNGQRMVWQ